MNSKDRLSTSVLMFVWGAALGTLFGLNYNGRISLHIGPPIDPIVTNRIDNHYTTEISVPSTAIVHGVGSASLTVNIPDQIEFREVVPSPLPPTPTEWPMQQHAVSTQRYLIAGQVESSWELKPFEYYSLKSATVNYGSLMVVSNVYIKDGASYVDVVNQNGKWESLSLAALAIEPYNSGNWNNRFRLFPSPIGFIVPE